MYILEYKDERLHSIIGVFDKKPTKSIVDSWIKSYNDVGFNGTFELKKSL